MITTSVNKTTIAEAFGAAAEKYDLRAYIQREIAADAIKWAQQLIKEGHHRHCLDVGCGTGSASVDLLHSAPVLTGVDIAPGMIQFAQAHHNESNAKWLVGDAEKLPMADASVDFIYSCMALQWLEHGQQFSSECARILSAEGEGLLAILTSGAMYELQDVWQSSELASPVNLFMSSDDWQRALKASGFNVTSKDVSYVDWHRDLLRLLHSIKDIGAGVSKGNRSRLTPGQLKRLESAYRLQFGNEKGLPLTYKVTYFHIKKR